MAVSSSVSVTGLLVLGVIISPGNAISCQEAITKLLPCQPYLLGFGLISAPCCQAAKDLNRLATSKPELKALCVCLKQAAISFGINGDRAKQIPELCHITVPVAIDPNIDCNSI